MRAFALVLVCLACASHGWPVDTAAEQGQPVENQAVVQALGALLLGLNSPTAFNMGTVRGMYQTGSRSPRGSAVMRHGPSLTTQMRKAAYDKVQDADLATIQSPEFEAWVGKNRRYRKLVRSKAAKLGTDLPEKYSLWDTGTRVMNRKIRSAKTADALLSKEIEEYVKSGGYRHRSTMLRNVKTQANKTGIAVPEGWGVVLNPKTEAIKQLKAAKEANTMEALDAALAVAEELGLDPDNIDEMDEAKDAKEELDKLEEAKKEAQEAVAAAIEGDDIEAIDSAVEKLTEAGIPNDPLASKAKDRKAALEKAAEEAAKAEAIEALKTATEGDDVEAIDTAMAAMTEKGLGDAPEMKAASSKKTELLAAQKAAEEAPAEEEKPAEE